MVPFVKSMMRRQRLRGFGLKVTPAGVKVYVLQYHVGTGRNARRRRLVIGRRGSPWTPEKARLEAKRLAGEIADGGDPLERRQQERKTMTIAELCDLYLAEGVAHKKRMTLLSDRARIEHHIKPLLGKRRLDHITRADVERLLTDVKAGKTAVEPNREKRRAGSIPRGGAGVAGQCVTLLGTLFAFAVKRGLRRSLSRPATPLTRRVLGSIEGRDQGYVRQVSAAAEGVVDHGDVAGRELEAVQGSAHGHGHGAQVDGHMIAHGDDSAVGIEHRARVIAPLLDIR